MAWADKFVTPSGAGAHSGADWANAWSLTEAATNAIADDRVFIEAGTYTLAANLTLPNAGSVGQAIAWIGVDSSHNPISGNRQWRTGPLETTDFPLITGTSGGYSVTSGQRNHLQNLRIESNLAGYPLTSGSYSTVASVKVENFYTGASSNGAFGSANAGVSHYNCDGVINSNRNDALAFYGNMHGVAANCRAWNATASQKGYGFYQIKPFNCIAFNLYFGVAIVNGGASPFCNLTIFDCVAAFYFNFGLYTAIVTENVVYDCPTMFHAHDSLNHFYAANNASDAATRLWLTGAPPHTEDNPIVLTADPFTDSANGDFTLNDVAGGGAICRGVGAQWRPDLGAVPVIGGSGGGGGGLALGRLISGGV